MFNACVVIYVVLVFHGSVCLYKSLYFVNFFFGGGKVDPGQRGKLFKGTSFPPGFPLQHAGLIHGWSVIARSARAAAKRSNRSPPPGLSNTQSTTQSTVGHRQRSVLRVSCALSSRVGARFPD